MLWSAWHFAATSLQRNIWSKWTCHLDKTTAMAREESGGSGKRRRRFGLVLCLLGLLLVIILAVVLALTLRRTTNELKPIFIERCQKFKEKNCDTLWDLFEQAYVNQDPCDVPPEAYDPLLSAAPPEALCNRMLFWSKTKNVVHEFTSKRDCLRTMEDSLLGSVLDGLTWCGMENSSETFTTGCPGWIDCVNNPVRSFWNKASATFAAVACGNVTVMLNGSIKTPFDKYSIFASVEVKNFNATRVKNLNVVLARQNNPVTNCTNGSLQDLKKELKEGIGYSCKEVPESQIHECSSQPDRPCGSCW